MRYRLRNQNKIRAHFEPNGEACLRRINESLKKHFSNAKNIEKDIQTLSHEPHPVLIINDIEHTVNMLSFYVIEKGRDYYLLAFKEFIG